MLSSTHPHELVDCSCCFVSSISGWNKVESTQNNIKRAWLKCNFVVLLSNCLNIYCFSLLICSLPSFLIFYCILSQIRQFESLDGLKKRMRELFEVYIPMNPYSSHCPWCFTSLLLSPKVGIILFPSLSYLIIFDCAFLPRLPALHAHTKTHPVWRCIISILPSTLPWLTQPLIQVYLHLCFLTRFWMSMIPNL